VSLQCLWKHLESILRKYSQIWTSLPTSESSKSTHFELPSSEREISKWFESNEIFSSEIASTDSKAFKMCPRFSEAFPWCPNTGEHFGGFKTRKSNFWRKNFIRLKPLGRFAFRAWEIQMSGFWALRFRKRQNFKLDNIFSEYFLDVFRSFLMMSAHRRNILDALEFRTRRSNF